MYGMGGRLRSIVLKNITILYGWRQFKNKYYFVLMKNYRKLRGCKSIPHPPSELTVVFLPPLGFLVTIVKWFFNIRRNLNQNGTD